MQLIQAIGHRGGGLIMAAASATTPSPAAPTEQAPVLLAAAGAITLTRDWNAWEGGRIEQVTDDPFVRGDLTPPSTKVSGIVRGVKVAGFQRVRNGDLLVDLQDDHYRILIVQAHREAAQARIQASDDLRNERQQQVKYGGSLEAEAIETRAQLLDLFDGGRNAAIGEHRAQLSQAEENLARIKEEVEVRVQTAYNKLERTRQMMKASEEEESRRVAAQQLEKGSALQSQAAVTGPQTLGAKAPLLQPQLD
jgi:membrane fusion protein (multidrug efflux system)